MHVAGGVAPPPRGLKKRDVRGCNAATRRSVGAEGTTKAGRAPPGFLASSASLTTLRAARADHFEMRPTYSLVRVSMRMTVFCSTKSGTCTVAPVATVAVFVALLAVSPFTAGSQ